MTTNTNAANTTNAREAAQRAAIEAMLTKWAANNPGGNVLRDVKIADA